MRSRIENSGSTTWKRLVSQGLQALKATIKVLSFGLPESLLTRISKDGRIVIPKLILDLLKHDKPNLEGYIMEITLEPS